MRLASIARASCATISACSSPGKVRAGARGAISGSIGSARSAASARVAGCAARARGAAPRRALRRRVRDRAFQHLLMRRDRVGQILHQPAEFADFGGQRRGRRARSVQGGRDFALHRDQAAVEFGHLAAMSAVPRERSAICAPIS